MEGIRQFLFALRRRGDRGRRGSLRRGARPGGGGVRRRLQGRTSTTASRRFATRSAPPTTGATSFRTRCAARIRSSSLIEASPSGEGDRRPGREPQGPGARRRAAVGGQRGGGGEPHVGLRPELRFRVHQRPRSALQHRAAPVLGAGTATGWRSSCARASTGRSSSRTSCRREIEHLIDLEMVDEPESPDFSPDGRTVAFLRPARRRRRHLRDRAGHRREVTNLTRSDFADYAPIYAPDGSYIVHMTRVSGNNKLFRRDGQTGLQTQLTFGTHDDSGPQFLDERTIMFASTAVRSDAVPWIPTPPGTARSSTSGRSTWRTASSASSPTPPPAT